MLKDASCFEPGDLVKYQDHKRTYIGIYLGTVVDERDGVVLYEIAWFVSPARLAGFANGYNIMHYYRLGTWCDRA